MHLDGDLDSRFKKTTGGRNALRAVLSHLFVQVHPHPDHIPALYPVFDNLFRTVLSEVIEFDTRNSKPALLVERHLDDAGISRPYLGFLHARLARFLYGPLNEFSSYPLVPVRLSHRYTHEEPRILPRWEDYPHWQKQDKQMVERIIKLIRKIQRESLAGIRKPEALKHASAGFWSRRITGEHRTLYRVEDNALLIA